ncbi:uncharacterized protein LOC115885580 [Sitophilus oryzae]|uniref:Uncharacterized protein LOC115885580 n=1 Tax=Sitophilus oryzae TaxID=7048 RepID=A0A6J2YAX8_SITOR|nr:uncharacterized protein LOC115885580 [Sitophilus oryzae]
MVAVFSRLVAFTNRHPVARGMLSYGTLWPTSCLIQQTMSGKTIENYDWIQALRFSLYGGLFTAPTLYAWIKLSSRLWPATSLKTSIAKVRNISIKIGVHMQAEFSMFSMHGYLCY